MLRDFLQNLRVLPDAYLQLFLARMHFVLFLPTQGVLIGIADRCDMYIYYTFCKYYIFIILQKLNWNLKNNIKMSVYSYYKTRRTQQQNK